MLTKIGSLLALVVLISLPALTGCATTVTTPFGTTYSYNGTTTYTPRSGGAVYHHSEAIPGGYCEVYSTGTGDSMQFSRTCHSY